MTIWTKLFGRRPKPEQRGRTAGRRHASSSAAVRRELVRVALRDTMVRHGIPSSWLAVDTQTILDSRGDTQMYVRLQLNHCEPQLISHALAFQNSLAKRIALLDGTAASWLRGIAWNLTLTDSAVQPQMPSPSTWQRARAAAAPEDAAPAAPQGPGPVRHDQLDRLREVIALGDVRHGGGVRHLDFQATQPFEDMEAQLQP